MTEGTTARNAVSVAMLVSLAGTVAGQEPSGGAGRQPGAGTLRFETHTITGELPGGYQPVVVDLNRDGRLDVIGLSTRLDELAWFQNPGWQRHVITTGLRTAINLAPEDLDGDGIPELVLAHEFGTSHDASLGVLLLLTHSGDPMQPWVAREIDRAPTAHRLRWADVEGTGNRVLINAPLVGPAASRPDFRDTVPIYWYRPDDWSRHVVTEAEEGVVHGLLVHPWDEDGRDAVLSASFVGVHLHRVVDGRWVRRRLTLADPAPWPRGGASEIGVGRLGTETFLATIEPWHGHQVVVYREDQGEGWTRGRDRHGRQRAHDRDRRLRRGRSR